MTRNPPITYARIHEAVSYDPTTGIFTWAKTSSKKRLDGITAGWVDDDGYIMISIDKITRGAHQWAWFWMTGEWPKQTVDHKDRDPGNNRWDNLREADYSQQSGNTRMRSDNTSGIKGVSWDKSRGKWAANIHIKGRKVYLGRFDDLDAARAAYSAAAVNYFGEFAFLAHGAS